MDKPTVIPVTPPPDEIEMEDPQTGEKRKVFSISSQLAFISMYPIFYEARPIRKMTDPQLLKNNIITSELRRIFDSYLSSKPHNEVVANMVFDCFRCAVDNELEDIITKNYSAPDFKYRKFIHTKVLRGKTLDDVQRIIKNASKRIEIKKEFIDVLEMTLHLVEMEKRGLLSLAMNELCLFYSIISNSFFTEEKRKKERDSLLENAKTNLKYERHIFKFIPYITLVENIWHPLQGKGIGKKAAIKRVFKKHINDRDFIQSFKDEFYIDPTEETGAQDAERLFAKLVDTYTKICIIKGGATRNGYKPVHHGPHSQETIDKISKSQTRRHALKKKRKRRSPASNKNKTE